MNKLTTGWLVALAALLPAGSLLAHHSLANHDTGKAVRVKGTDGRIRRWAIEGPSVLQLTRQGLEKVLKPGDVIEVCGYPPKEALMWQIASADPGATSLAGRLLTAELLVMPDGREQSWGDYGFHHCFAPGHRDQHSK